MKAKAVAGPAVLVGALLLGACSSAVSPTPTASSSDTTSAANQPVTADGPVSFQTSDGFLLEGVLYGSDAVSPTAVVLAHMFPADQESWRPTAMHLADQGFAALTFNFRGYGDSEGEKDIANIDRDVGAALDFLLSQGFDQVVLVGASMGGTASVIVASQRTNDVVGLVSLSAPRSFQSLDASVAAQNMNVPSLFIASQNDGAAPDNAQWFADNGAGSAAVQIYSGSAHGTDIFDGPHQDALGTLLLDFLEDPQATVDALKGNG